MKVAILSESAADQAAVHIFVNALLGHSAELYPRSFRTRGWTTVFNVLPNVLRELHYCTDVDALAVVMDSDKSQPHLAEHDQMDVSDTNCRLCRLREVVRVTQSQLKDTGRAQVRVAIGLAVPCIEAWLRNLDDAHITEAAWLLALREGQFPYDNMRLKKAVYGTDRLGLELQTRRMMEEANRLANDIARLETWFPNGFGPFATAVRSWSAT